MASDFTDKFQKQFECKKCEKMKSLNNRHEKAFLELK